MKIKAGGTEVYTVGVYNASTAANIESFMNQLSSNYVSHSFATEPVRMDMSKASTRSTFLKYTRNIDGSYYGIYPYFYKDEHGNYWPVSVSYDPTVDKNIYYASYITDEAEKLIDRTYEAIYRRTKMRQYEPWQDESTDHRRNLQQQRCCCIEIDLAIHGHPVLGCGISFLYSELYCNDMLKPLYGLRPSLAP
jgi:hypothetical protein